MGDVFWKREALALVFMLLTLGPVLYLRRVVQQCTNRAKMYEILKKRRPGCGER